MKDVRPFFSPRALGGTVVAGQTTLEHDTTKMSLKITVKEASKLPNIRLTALGTSDPLAVVKFRGTPKAKHAGRGHAFCTFRPGRC